MEKAITDKVRKSVSKKLKKDEVIRVEILREEKEEFINRTIASLEGYFTLRHQRNDYFYFGCERSRKSQGKHSGDPSCTRANSCPAYCSIKFEHHGLLNVCVVKTNPVHSGHEIGNPDHAKKNRIHPELREFIHLNFSEGQSNAETLLAAASWSTERGFLDKTDRRYYPSRIDIKYLRHAYKKANPDMDITVTRDVADISPPDTRPSVKQMLSDLLSYVSNEGYETNPECEDLIHEAHEKVFAARAGEAGDHIYMHQSKGPKRKGLKRKNSAAVQSVLPEQSQIVEIDTGLYSLGAGFEVQLIHP
ncbi:hypothetical protein CAPTEDRAFT_220090 [Capitella teleta]|uniref:Uncharacterized protein n=1 Tax=Capitella teleta TaxID=283909 RepID=R7UXX1_CAPTE|nr:hypothetical protein CAPTEDRAFT_220090 [Capitella teleta]|eukprot:ELU08271.1 hypothetical protein CAPTEDRAFT_220090 [Capitella teleta]